MVAVLSLAVSVALLLGDGLSPPRGASAAENPRARGSMAAEIHAAQQNERSAVRVLEARLQSVTDARAALELQRSIERAKLETRIGILRVRAHHARAAGRTLAALEMEAAVARLEALRARAGPGR